MVSKVSQLQSVGDDAPDDASQPRRGSRRAVRALVFFTAGLLLLIGFVVTLVVVVLPYLASRGDLDAFVEKVLRASFNREVQIGSLETDPLSRFNITHISSLKLESADSSYSEFSCERVSVLYSPIDLVFGHIEELSLVRPRIAINFDKELEDVIATWPPEQRSLDQLRDPRSEPLPRARSGSSGFGIGHLGLENGELKLRYVGQDFHLEKLNVNLYGLGDREDLSFELNGNLGESELDVRGEVLARRDGGDFLDIPEAQIRLENFNLRPLVSLLDKMLSGFAVDARVDLRGSLRGRWPRRVELQVRSDFQLDDVDVDLPDLDGASLDVRFDAEVIGELEQINFDLELAFAGGGEDSRAARLSLAGRYEAGSHGGTVFFEEQSRLESSGLGTVKIDGVIRSFLEEPVLDVVFQFTDLDLKKTVETPVLGTFLGELERFDGFGALTVEVRGPLVNPVFGGNFKLKHGGVKLSEEHSIAAAVQGSVARIADVFENEGPEVDDVRVSVRGLNLQDLARIVQWTPRNLRLAGLLDLSVEVPTIRPPALPEEWRIGVLAREVEVAILGETIATEHAQISGTLEVRPLLTGDRLAFQTSARLELRAPYLVVGDVVEDLSREVVTLNAAVYLEPRSGEADREVYDAVLNIQLLLPSLGPVQLTGTATLIGSPIFSVADLDLRVEASRIPNRDFLGVYVGAAHEETLPFLAGSSFSGFSSGVLRIRKVQERFEASGRLISHMDRVQLPAADFEVEGLTIDMPLQFGGSLVSEEIPEGSLALRRLRFGGLELQAVELPLRLDVARSRLESQASSFGFLGGRADVSGLTVDWSGQGQPFQLAMKVRDADLEGFARAMDWPKLEGRVNADLESLTITGETLQIDGVVDFETFGGQIRLMDLVIDNYSLPYFTVRLGSGSLRDLDLGLLGEALGFGLMSGILDGMIEDLELNSEEVFRFKVDVETGRRPDVEQFINKNVVRSLQTLLTPFSGFEDLFLSRFYYEGLGFVMSLEDGRFRLRGKYVLDGVEYLMYSKWYHWPRVDIINGRPDIDYDWERVQAHVKQVIAGDDEGAR